MSEPNVGMGVALVVEDQDPLRTAIVRALRARGFDTLEAKTAHEAEREISATIKAGRRIDVAVCDMLLEKDDSSASKRDNEYPTKTGAQVAEKLVALSEPSPPEIIFFTAHGREEFFQAALRVHAVYLRKGPTTLDDLVRLVRVLGLRRQLRVDDPAIAQHLDEIGRQCVTTRAAFFRLWRELWAPRIEERLGVAAALSMRLSDGSIHVSGRSLSLPPDTAALLWQIQPLIQHEVGKDRLFVLQPGGFEKIVRPKKPIPAGLEGAIMIPIMALPEPVFLLIRSQCPNEERPASALMAVAETIDRYLRIEMVRHIARLLEEIETAKRNQHMLRLTARMCSVISSYQRDVSLALRESPPRPVLAIDEAADLGNKDPICELDALSDALRGAANRLDDLSIPADLTFGDRTLDENIIDGRRLVWRAWEHVQKPPHTDEALTLESAGACFVSGAEEDYIHVFSALLQWMVMRMDGPSEGRISVSCLVQGRESLFRFKDPQGTFPAPLRNIFFEPFATSVPRPGGAAKTTLDLDIYVATMIAQLRLSGAIRLKDSGGLGYQFELRFPAPQGGHETVHGGAL